MEAKNYSKLLEENAELESLASLGGLVAAIAHEINSPLGAILSSANVAMLAAEKLTSGPDAKVVDALLTNARVISEATRRISSLVGRLRVFAGIDQSRYARVDLVQSIEDTVALWPKEAIWDSRLCLADLRIRGYFMIGGHVERLQRYV